MDKLQIKSSEAVNDKASVFRGHALKVNNSSEIRLAYKKMKLMYPESNHIMMGYSMKKYVGNCDDGEFGAGKRLQKIVSENPRANGTTVVFVTREFGGIHLGPRRFIHIERVAREAMTSLYPV